MANYGLKVAKPGKSADSNDIADHHFNSEKACLKLDFENNSDTKSYSVSASTNTTKTVSHDFDFIPGFLSWFEVDNSGDWYFMYTTSSEDVTCRPYTDTNNINFELNNGDGSSHNINVFYVLLADRAGSWLSME